MPSSACARRRGASRRARALARAVRRAGPGAWALTGYLAASAATIRVLPPIALHFAWQIAFLKPDDPADCLASSRPTPRSAGCCGRHRRRPLSLMARLPADPEGFIRANTALERRHGAGVQAVARHRIRADLAGDRSLAGEQNIDPPYWAFCWPGGQAIARYLLDNPERCAASA
jgi:hypothetical protein